MQQDENMGAPCRLLSKGGHTEIASILLNKGADINASEDNVGAPCKLVSREQILGSEVTRATEA
jgi:hypothetical protein